MPLPPEAREAWQVWHLVTEKIASLREIEEFWTIEQVETQIEMLAYMEAQQNARQEPAQVEPRYSVDPWAAKLMGGRRR